MDIDRFAHDLGRAMTVLAVTILLVGLGIGFLLGWLLT
jgi:hypothetical protein